LLVLSLLAPTAHAGAIAVSQSVDKSSIAYTDSLLFDITLRWEGSQAAYRFDKPLNLPVSGLKVKGFSSSISSSPMGETEQTTKKFRFVLEPVSAGTAVIEPFAIEYLSWPDSIPGKLMTEVITVSIAAPEPPAPESKYRWILWLAVPLGLLVAVGVLVHVFRGKSRRSSQPVRTAREIFLERLAEVRLEAGDDLKKFQTGLYKIMVAFLREQHNLDAADIPDNELGERLLAAGVDSAVADRISGWLSRARRDKFSPVSAAPGETVRLETEIRQLFENL
ncbi:MAG: hypothetical protein JSW34_01855, partial [Candidatus Zixiibacteriota bacterium]